MVSKGDKVVFKRDGKDECGEIIDLNGGLVRISCNKARMDIFFPIDTDQIHVYQKAELSLEERVTALEQERTGKNSLAIWEAKYHESAQSREHWKAKYTDLNVVMRIHAYKAKELQGTSDSLVNAYQAIFSDIQRVLDKDNNNE